MFENFGMECFVYFTEKKYIVESHLVSLWSCDVNEFLQSFYIKVRKR